jgi:hypothetical protein
MLTVQESLRNMEGKCVCGVNSIPQHILRSILTHSSFAYLPIYDTICATHHFPVEVILTASVTATYLAHILQPCQIKQSHTNESTAFLCGNYIRMDDKLFRTDENLSNG